MEGVLSLLGVISFPVASAYAGGGDMIIWIVRACLRTVCIMFWLPSLYTFVLYILNIE